MKVKVHVKNGELCFKELNYEIKISDNRTIFCKNVFGLQQL